ncbi:cilia- and flagella-associated protein 36 isoform X2 [Odontomachus brunneus]|nr:cilia- and flagella-associated protein 36 isoform X2 [Odontomachus brunneus]
MEDMSITPEQFEHACSVNKNTKIPIQFQQNLFEQIWAANEYEIFKRMMIQKNLELQLQALNMIEQKYGLTPASFVYETDGLHDDELVMEDLIHKHVLIDQSKEEPGISPETLFVAEHERLAAEYYNERALLEEALRKSQDASRNASDDESTEEIECASREKEPVEKFRPMRRFEPLNPIPTPKKESNEESNGMNAEDIKKRQDYLKARRDKLVALKKEARSQQLEMNKTRPSSARVVAEATMKGQELEAAQAVDPSLLQVRRALAARLKAEVVHK